MEYDVALGLLRDGGLLVSDDVDASHAWNDLVRLLDDLDYEEEELLPALGRLGVAL